MAQGGGVHTTMNGALEVNVGVSEETLVGMKVFVGLAVGVLNWLPFLMRKVIMIMPRIIVRRAMIPMIPIMVLDFIRFS